jgi:hypothetical protein
VTPTRAREMLLLNSDPRSGEMSILSDHIDNARLTEGVLLYLASIGLVAAAVIVLFSVASFSLLGASKETLTGSRIDSNAAPVPVQTKSPSSSDAHNLPSSTLVSRSSGMSSEGTAVEPAFKPLRDGEQIGYSCDVANACRSQCSSGKGNTRSLHAGDLCKRHAATTTIRSKDVYGKLLWTLLR